MRVLITGANGYVARTIAKALDEDGHHVTGIHRHVPEEDWSPQMTVDMQSYSCLMTTNDYQKADWAEIFRRSDIVFLAAGSPLTGPIDPAVFKQEVETADLMSSAAKGLERPLHFFLVSSIHAGFSKEKRTGSQFNYQELKKTLENRWRQALKTSPHGLAVLRLASLQGARMDGRDRTVLGRISSIMELPLIVPYTAGGSVKRFLRAENLSDLARFLLANPNVNGTYEISDGEGVETSVVLHRIRENVNARAVLLPLPRFAFKIIDFLAQALFAGSQMSRFLDWLARDENSNAASYTSPAGWQPPIDQESGLEYTLDELKAN